MANVLKAEKKLAVLKLLVEGNSIRSIERITGVQKKTIMRLLVKVGTQCRAFLDHELRGLELRHVQCDEIHTFVRVKQAHIHVDERSNPTIGDQFLWVGFDTDTKLVASFCIGKRTGDMARRFMVDLRGRLNIPAPHASDMHNYLTGGFAPVVQISTDGFAAYPESVDMAFGPYAKFGTIVKDYRNAVMPYTPSEIVGTKRRAVFSMKESEERTICTSHVERNNLTIRTFIRRFTRLSLGFSKKLENLAAAVALHVAHYNFVRRHGSLRVTPAMAAGVTDRLWSLEDLLVAVSRY